MAVKAVFLDIDDTLISMDKGGPFDDDVEAIEKARRNGTRFFLCTGRSFGQIQQVLLDASWKDGIVAGAGAHVILGDKTLYHNWIPIPVLCEVSSLFLGTEKRCSFRGDECSYVINRDSGRISIGGQKIFITQADDFEQKYPDARVSMLTVDLNIDQNDRALLEKYFIIYPQIPHFDCIIKGEGKAKGMKVVLDNLGLDRKDSIAIGDSANDLDMIEYAGTSIAVGNACDALKAKASWISAPVGEGAIAKALEHLGLC
jgi:Cof subfamily protein (haloacid dehalogenase superfamily)